MLSTRVHANHITSLTDARYFAALEVTALGFNLEQGTDTYMSPQQLIAIKEWVEGPQIIGQFGMQPVETIQEAVTTIGLDGVQLGHFAPVDYAMRLPDVVVIKEIVLEEALDRTYLEQQLFTFGSYVDRFILTGRFQWQTLAQNPYDLAFLRQCCKDYRIVIAFDFAAAELPALLSGLAPYGIGVTGGEEEAVGVKSFDELDDLFEHIQMDL